MEKETSTSDAEHGVESCFADTQFVMTSLPVPDAQTTSLAALHDRLVEIMKEKGIHRCISSLDIPVDATVAVLEPSLKSFHSRFEARIPLLILSNKGYNFSAEYEVVYQGSSPSESNLKDFQAVLRRSLLTFDPALPSPSLERYSELILYHVLHTESMAAELCSLSFAQSFPHITTPDLLLSTYYPTRVYLGKDKTQQLCFWVRVCCEMSEGRGRALAFMGDQTLMYFACTRRLTLHPSAIEDTLSLQNKSFKKQIPISSLGSTSVFLVSLARGQEFNSYFGEVDEVPEETTSVLNSMSTKEGPSYLTMDAIPDSQISFAAEIFSWGAAGADEKSPHDLTSLSLPPTLIAQKIRMLACSQTHCLVLSCAGTIFSFGDNDEGALGLGDLVPRLTLTRVEFSDESETPVITKIAAGSSVIGSHSLALDENGRLYSFGVAYACGHSSLKPCLRPAELRFLPPPNPTEKYGRFAVRDISCGGGFSAVVMASGIVATWGFWAHGRLGLGRPRTLNVRGKTKLMKYQMTPKALEGISDAVSIATGDAHTLCITQSGHLYSWGRNSVGQIGVGCDSTGFLRDRFEPVIVCFPDSVGICKIQCGENHSLAVDVNGTLWTWGARGRPCLGRGSYGVNTEWELRLNSIFHPRQMRVMIPHELLSWCDGWARPGIVAAMSGKIVAAMAAGAHHSAFVTSNGRLFLCGEGSVVSPFFSNAFVGDEADSSGDISEDSRESRILRIIRSVSTPRCPSSAWLSKLCSRRTVLICSFGERCFVVQDEDLIGADLGQNLLGKLLGTTSSQNIRDWETDSLDSIQMSSDEPQKHILDQRGSADCLITTSGHTLLGHQALLSRRSGLLRDIILNESTVDGTRSFANILLPELRYDTTKALVQYLYTDNLCADLINDVSLLYSLNRTANMFNLPRMAILSDILIRLLTKAELESETKGFDIPPCTLAKDFSTLVGDPTFADMCFIAEGRTIYAHKFVLQNRCNYFQIMLNSGMMETIVTDGIITISVPGTVTFKLSFFK